MQTVHVIPHHWDHLPALQPAPTTLGPTIPGDLVSPSPPGFVQYHSFCPVSTQSQCYFQRKPPPPLVPGGTPGPFSVPYPWAGALRNKAKASLCISLSRAPISRAWASEAPLTPVLARYLEQQMAPTLCVCPEP